MILRRYEKDMSCGIGVLGAWGLARYLSPRTAVYTICVCTTKGGLGWEGMGVDNAELLAQLLAIPTSLLRSFVPCLDVHFATVVFLSPLENHSHSIQYLSPATSSSSPIFKRLQILPLPDIQHAVYTSEAIPIYFPIILALRIRECTAGSHLSTSSRFASHLNRPER